jgi:hypothetical protein
MNDTFRAYDIERDSDGKPFRLMWRGDFTRVVIIGTTCPKCAGAPPLRDGRCFTCWRDFRESRWVQR